MQTILLIMNVNDINGLKIKWHKKSNPYGYFLPYPDLNEKSVKKYIYSLTNRMLIKMDQIPLLVRIILRNMFGGKLYNNQTMYVHFGFDYYMYIGSKISIESVCDKITEMKLFVEEMNSPYLNGYEKRYYFGAMSKKKQDGVQ